MWYLHGFAWKTTFLWSNSYFLKKGVMFIYVKKKRLSHIHCPVCCSCFDKHIVLRENYRHKEHLVEDKTGFYVLWTCCKQRKRFGTSLPIWWPSPLSTNCPSWLQTSTSGHWLTWKDIRLLDVFLYKKKEKTSTCLILTHIYWLFGTWKWKSLQLYIKKKYQCVWILFLIFLTIFCLLSNTVYDYWEQCQYIYLL